MSYDLYAETVNTVCKLKTEMLIKCNETNVLPLCIS